VTFLLIPLSLVLALILGIPAGLAAGLAQRRGVDLGIRSAATLCLAFPPYLIGLVLLLVFSLNAGWFPAGGWPGEWPANLEYVVLPSVALAAFVTPLVTRTVRQAASDVGGEQFVEAAMARGIPERTIVLRHILPNTLVPLMTLIGLLVGGMIGSAAVVEAVFNLPGLGTALAQAVHTRDYTVIQGIALVTALIVVGVNLVIDLLCVLVDPRTRRGA
jgi:peptide/nickel transport system permease protein